MARAARPRRASPRGVCEAAPGLLAPAQAGFRSSSATDLRKASSSTGAAAPSAGSSGWSGRSARHPPEAAAGGGERSIISEAGGSGGGAGGAGAGAGRTLRATDELLHLGEAADLLAHVAELLAEAVEPPVALAPDALPLVLGVLPDGVPHLRFRQLLLRLTPLPVELRLRRLVPLQITRDRGRVAAKLLDDAAQPRLVVAANLGANRGRCVVGGAVELGRATARTGRAARGELRCWCRKTGCWPWRMILSTGAWDLDRLATLWWPTR